VGKDTRFRSPLLVLVVLLGLALGGMLLASCSSDEAEPSDTGAATEDTTEGSGTTSAPSGDPYTDISPDELAQMLESKDFLLINTHVPYEGEIEQTDLFIPYDTPVEQIADLPEDKSAKMVLYCRSDRMSRIAAEAWADAGYDNLYNLDGGFVAWEQAGYELLQK